MDRPVVEVEGLFVYMLFVVVWDPAYKAPLEFLFWMRCWAYGVCLYAHASVASYFVIGRHELIGACVAPLLEWCVLR